MRTTAVVVGLIGLLRPAAADACAQLSCADTFCYEQPSAVIEARLLDSINYDSDNAQVRIEIVSASGADELVPGTEVELRANKYAVSDYYEGDTVLFGARRTGDALVVSAVYDPYDLGRCFEADSSAAAVASVVLGSECVARLEPIDNASGASKLRACCSAGGYAGGPAGALAALALIAVRRRRRQS